MVTLLQRAVEIVEDRHAGEKLKRSHCSNAYYNRQGRGSVLNATPAELSILHSLSKPMNCYDNHVAKCEGHKKSRRYYGEISSRRKNA